MLRAQFLGRRATIFELNDFQKLVRPVLGSKYRARGITHGFDIYLEIKILRKLLIFLRNCPTFVLGVFIWSSQEWFPRVFYFSTNPKPIPNRSQTNPRPVLRVKS